MMGSIDVPHVFEKTCLLPTASRRCPEGPHLGQRRCPQQCNSPFCAWQGFKTNCLSCAGSPRGKEKSNEAAHDESCTNWRWRRFRSECASWTECARTYGVEMAESYASHITETRWYVRAVKSNGYLICYV